MTKWKVEITESAERDLAEAMTYIHDQLGNPQAALRLLDEFESRVGDLSSGPFVYPRVRHARLSRLGYRWVNVGNYMAFYTTDRTTETVTIDRLLFGRANWRMIL